MSQLTPEQAEAKLAEKLVKPIDELSTFSVGIVAEAAETIAKAKAEAAVKALEAAQAAMARVAAMKAGQTTAPAAAVEKTAPAAPIAAKPAVPAATPKTVAVLSADVPAKPAEAPAAVAASTAPVLTPDVEFVERRSTEPRRSDQERREMDEAGKESPADTPERRAEVRRLALGRREDDPSGVHRMAHSVRSASQAISADRLAVKHSTAPKVPGRVLEPVAHQAGLYAPRGNGAKRKIVTPKLVMLFALMVLFGMYATGNLPQFDQWTDSVVNQAHTHNDQIVNGMVSGWHIAAYAGAAFALFLMVFLIFNSMRARGSNDDL